MRGLVEPGTGINCKECVYGSNCNVARGHGYHVKSCIQYQAELETGIFDIVEEHDHCHVQVLRNSITGEVSVGWWEEKE